MYLVKPNTLSLAFRAQMLDELSQGNFLTASAGRLTFTRNTMNVTSTPPPDGG